MIRNLFFLVLFIGISLFGGVRITALDAHHLAVQIDLTAEEHARFQLTQEELALEGWQFDNAFDDAAKRAQEGRSILLQQIQEGKVFLRMETGEVREAEVGYWVSPNGLACYPDGKGHDNFPSRIPELMHTVFLALKEPMRPGETFTVEVPLEAPVPFLYAPETAINPAFKVNQVGYQPEQREKYAYFGAWLGTLGPLPKPVATTFEVVNAKDETVVFTGKIVFRKEDPLYEGKYPFTGEETVEMDISALNRPGVYYLRAEGLGRSRAFRVAEDSLGRQFAMHIQGLTAHRCGLECHSTVLRGVHPSEQDEYGSCFVDINGEKVETRHFGIIKTMLPYYLEQLQLPGGWHDAADYDRRPMHLKIVGDFCVLYLLQPEKFTDSQLPVPERGNGIPDLLDEAIWGIQHLLLGQQKDGGVGTWIETYHHPGTKDFEMPSQDKDPYTLSGATRNSSLEYAGYAALLARTLRRFISRTEKAGKTPPEKAVSLANRLQESAIRAWNFAQTTPPRKTKMLTPVPQAPPQEVFYQEPSDYHPFHLLKAALNLNVLTRDAKYLAPFHDESLIKEFKELVSRSYWSFSPFALGELNDDSEKPADAFVYDMRGIWNNYCVKQANVLLKQLENAYPYRLPWWPSNGAWVHTMGWGNYHPLRRAMTLCAAHAATLNPVYLTAAYLAVDYQSGCNPNGTTFTSGLGDVFPIRFLSLQSRADGIAEYIRGITPYRNTFGLHQRARTRVWHDDTELTAKYPILRRWANMEEQTVTVSEYTVWETIAPAAVTCAYLMPAGIPIPLDDRPYASDLRTLEGYWVLP